MTISPLPSFFRTRDYVWDEETAHSSLTISNEGRTVKKTGGAGWCNVKGNFGLSTGKWYWEIHYDSIVLGAGVTQGAGICPSSISNNARVGVTSNDISFEEWPPGLFYNNGSGLWGLAMANNDTLMVAYDAYTGKLWFGKNGTWMDSGDPEAGTNEVAFGGSPLSFTGEQFPTFDTYPTNNQVTLGTSDDFCTYDAPSGFHYLNFAI